MNHINRLGVKVALVTGSIVLLIAGTVWGVRALLGVLFADEAPAQVAGVEDGDEMAADSDGDGLADLVENIYRSDPNNPDTDGDGVSDGDEVAARRDPTVAGPEDAFNVDQAVEVLSDDTYTRRYMETLPTDLSPEGVRDPERIQAFIAGLEEPLLSSIPDEDIRLLGPNQNTKEAVAAYLDRTSASHNPEIAVISNADILQAFQVVQATGQRQRLDEIIAQLDKTVQILEESDVPPAARALHVKQLAAARALRDNVELMAGAQEDFIGGLVGAKRIEELGPVFAGISQDMANLEAQFGIE